MPLNNANEAIEAKRRDLVSSFLLRGMSQREVQEALAGAMKNPLTDEPYSLGTVNGDIKRLRLEWRKSAAANTEVHKARQLAEIREVKRQAWTDNDPALVLRAIDLEANITGTKAPQRNELTGPDGNTLHIVIDR